LAEEEHIMRRTTIAVLLAVSLSACGTFQVGGNFDLAAFQSKVRRGETTQAEVQRMLGAPDGKGVSVETSGERYVQWTYYYGSGSLSGPSNARLKMLQVKFDQAGVVRAYNWSGEE
jgi:outer membrane protein assembly factor BamE (lipoprotein component of BamABCDE complex)